MPRRTSSREGHAACRITRRDAQRGTCATCQDQARRTAHEAALLTVLHHSFVHGHGLILGDVAVVWIGPMAASKTATLERHPQAGQAHVCSSSTRALIER